MVISTAAMDHDNTPIERAEQMSTTGLILRWAHLVAGGAWLGAVAMVVFVLVPALHRLDEPLRGRLAMTVFPRVFRLASVLSLTAITTGAALYLERFGWRLELRPLVTGRWGWSILIGGSLALLLTVFHFFAEGLLAPHVRGAADTPVDSRVLTVLRIAPRIGLAILVTVIILMAYAVRGL
jgi:putative copper export protein